MPTIGGPRLLESKEFDELMTMLDRCFSYEQDGMAAHFPFVYNPKYPERHAVITIDGEIVAHAACVPETLSIGDGNTVSCCGIGGVATAKPHRGNGYMSRLLEFWLDRIDNKEVPLVELGGDRKRYGRFGWEPAGRDAIYTIDPGSVSDTSDKGDVFVYHGDESTLRALRRLHCRDPLRIIRDGEAARTIYDQRGLETLVYSEGEGPQAYLSFSRASRRRSIKEIGGDIEGIESLLAYLFERYDSEMLSAYVHPTARYNELLGTIASRWRTQPSRLLNIRDLPMLTETYASILERRWNRRSSTAEGTITLGIDEDENAIRVAYGLGSLSVTPFESNPELSLDRRAMTRLLFGGEGRMNRLKSAYPILDALFPIDYYVWYSERV